MERLPTFKRQRATVSDALAHAGISLDTDWRHQDPVALSKIAIIARSQNNQLRSYKGNWATLKIMKTTIKNKRNYRTRIGCSTHQKPVDANEIKINNVNPENQQVEIELNNSGSENQEASGSGAAVGAHHQLQESSNEFENAESLFSNSDEENLDMEGSSSGEEGEENTNNQARTKRKAMESGGGKGKQARV
ncbi:hypothetical protein BYT27DRAFT_7260177 [Phlegmacium glaucopus]|nr:hypothetical protein BYT27DRAFT_7260177 [Phlegmacium glaucopus]